MCGLKFVKKHFFPSWLCWMSVALPTPPRHAHHSPDPPYFPSLPDALLWSAPSPSIGPSWEPSPVSCSGLVSLCLCHSLPFNQAQLNSWLARAPLGSPVFPVFLIPLDLEGALLIQAPGPHWASTQVGSLPCPSPPEIQPRLDHHHHPSPPELPHLGYQPLHLSRAPRAGPRFCSCPFLLQMPPRHSRLDSRCQSSSPTPAPPLRPLTIPAPKSPKALPPNLIIHSF